MRVLRVVALVLLALGGLSLSGCAPGDERSTGEKAAAAAVRGVNRARKDATLGRLERLRAVLERYRIDHGEYPAGDSLAAIGDRLVPQYTPRLETRDSWGNDLSYESSGGSYTIVSSGPDGARGTPDDIRLQDGAVSGGP
ncbi:MAG: type II secretion system protein GspG [Acidobacteriota bacterium]